MDLFELVNRHAHPSIHALLIDPFKTIWENDPSKNKEYAIKIFTYVELTCSPKKSNPFHGYGEKVRISKVRKEVFGDEDIQLDEETIKDILACKAKYIILLEESSFGYSMYTTAINAAERLKEFLDTLNPNSRTNAGGLLLKPKDIAMTLQELPNLIKKLREQRDTVLEELSGSSSKTRNSRTINKYERG